MTLKEFLTNNPEAVNEAANCKSVKEFQDLAAKIGLTFNSSSEAQEAFNMVKSRNNGELSDDDLDAVSGGAKQYYVKDLQFDSAGNVYGKVGKKYKGK